MDPTIFSLRARLELERNLRRRAEHTVELARKELKGALEILELVKISWAHVPPNHYAQADLETKRQALSRVATGARPAKPPRWKSDQDLLAWLDSL